MKNNHLNLLKAAFLGAIACAAGTQFAGAEELPADSTEPMGQTFSDPAEADVLRVLLAGAGDHHHFPRYFLGTDSETLNAVEGIETAATPNLRETLELLPQADVVVFSGNHRMYGRGAFQDALRAHADAGKGIVLVHAAVWVHDWDGYNERFVQGGSRSHGFGEIEATVLKSDHPVTAGVPETFTIVDESYHHYFQEGADVEVLVENAPDGQTDRPHASVWVVNDSEARIVCITFGHDGRAHDNPAYQTLLTNAVKWVAGKE